MDPSIWFCLLIVWIWVDTFFFQILFLSTCWCRYPGWNNKHVYLRETAVASPTVTDDWPVQNFLFLPAVYPTYPVSGLGNWSGLVTCWCWYPDREHSEYWETLYPVSSLFSGQSLHIHIDVILKFISGGVSSSGCAVIQCFTIWDFAEKASAFYMCSTAHSCNDLEVFPI